MKKILLLNFLILFSSLLLYSQVNDYEMFRKAGLVNFTSGQYKRALFNFKVAQECADKPATNDIEEWIKKATKCNKLKIKAESAYELNNFCEAKEYYLQILEVNSEDETALLRIKDCREIALPPAGMVFVKGGSFSMGSNSGDIDEKPIHQVTISSFYIDQYEVTNKEFCVFLNAKGNQQEEDCYWINVDDEDCFIKNKNGRFRPERGYAEHPVVNVSWYGARAYAKWANKRLPTEAEWEFAARGGILSKNTLYAGGNKINEVAWWDGNSNSSTQPVGQKLPNELNLFDMSGNVWEWCSDWYDIEYYKVSEKQDPQGPSFGDFRVLRGGGWVVVEHEIRCTMRNYNPSDTYNFALGFRCVKDIK